MATDVTSPAALAAACSGAPSPSASGRKAGWAQGAILVLAGFLPILAIVSLTPAVPTILDHFRAAGQIGADASLMVTLLVTAPGLSIALLSPFAGMLVDRYGRRPLLVGAALIYGAVGAAPYFLDSLKAIIASRLALGVAEAAILTIVNTLIGDYFTPAGRRWLLMVQGMAGPALASLVIAGSGALTAVGWNASFLIYLSAIPIFLGMYVYIFEPAGDAQAAARPQAPGAATPFPWKAVVTFGAATLFASSLYYVFIVQGGLAFREVGVDNPADAGKYISLASLAVPVGALIFGVVGARGTALQVLMFLGLLGAGLTGVGLAHDPTTMVALLVIQQMGAGMTVPTLVAWAQGVLPFEHRGRGMGVWSSCFFLGQFTSPMFVALAKGAMGTGAVQPAFVVMGCIALAGAAVAAVLALKPRQRR
ncbi:MFS transporter [Nitrospirillum sp. BR 11164]|uniref:MFS transporter n=1 Tax=Nitrospirillum sp. BR 11164 TaxID=3104324 RepID=UPI002AFEA482|nr:MFS transporter [Nitrospirillum sp. BR 11164]MEA1652796.1 MFS transporter [Nitrospirillum sp. BR 11164]